MLGFDHDGTMRLGSNQQKKVEVVLREARDFVDRQ